MTATNTTTIQTLNSADNMAEIREAIPSCLSETNFSFGKKYQGKVRDVYDLGDKLMLITTDRLSAFDRQLALIPYKGQVLNLTSAWWFGETANEVPNHLIAIPDPNVVIVKKCTVFPIEFVVRGYITGTTETSLWTQYQKGVRNYCGISLKEGLRKNQKLESAVLTPTTKEKLHDRPITPHEIVSEGWMSKADWDEASALALKLYEIGVHTSQKHGLILVDTKYEFGRDETGRIVVVDEIHTPDSSRYWLANSYEERFLKQLEPENIDKEFLRLWFSKNCNPYQDAHLPKAPQELIESLSARYIQLYEMITGRAFDFAKNPTSIDERILCNVASFLE